MRGRAGDEKPERQKDSPPPLSLEVHFPTFRLWIIALIRHLNTNITTIHYFLFTKEAKSDDLGMI